MWMRPFINYTGYDFVDIIFSDPPPVMETRKAPPRSAYKAAAKSHLQELDININFSVNSGAIMNLPVI